MAKSKIEKAKGDQPKKVAVDKTFGMKNKKGAKGQQQVKVLQQQQAMAGKTPAELAAQRKREEDKRAKAEAEKLRKKEMENILIIQPKVPFGVDPKTVTCEFWKHGKCDKSANRCKFAHEHNANRKVEKKDLYTDMREGDEDAKKSDTMDKWDEAKLQQVVLSKHGNPKSTTDKVCKYFLTAVEDGKYGWFWVCPNGGDNCMYRHALPPGFVLKSQRKAMEEEEKANEISLEDFLESARHKLGAGKGTPVTEESFKVWKQRRTDAKQAQEDTEKAKKAQQAAANKMAGLTGREIWQQERQAEEEREGGVSDGEDEPEAEQADAAASNEEKMASLSVNGDEGQEVGRRKE
ncbi:Uncharacterized conserved protein, contains CCCH-type Zn-finger [Ceraceosorus bombacis]|uniref:Uncharacterized conserved protein, contains CCCH-type Zn-finger n=1 Tax=Ceraceosorus bombacis TaxID=401625 RepID=A0A0P1BER9_9BASI|nr:Uncharacterized conserved protein, contains CCCH-type Zn-finger [Ceraceosorus bombacis]